MTTDAPRVPIAGTAVRPLRRKRVRPADALFHAGVLSAILVALAFLAWLLADIVVSGAGALDWDFLTGRVSANPERAGFVNAIRGTFVLMLITMLVALPIGFAAAVYLEKFANTTRSQLEGAAIRRRREYEALVARGELGPLRTAWMRARLAGSFAWARVGPRTNQILEVNISNLAAVPSIIYGLLGLAIFVSFIGLQKSLLAGGLTLGLLVVPIIIIASREAVRAVPVSIEQGAMALGATRFQAVMRQTVPAALPGMLTGAILAMSRAIGESAPLVVVGGVVFSTAVPSIDPTQSGSESLFAMPLQIFFWAGQPQEEFREIAAAGIIVLLSVLVAMNAIAIVLRNRFSRRW